MTRLHFCSLLLLTMACPLGAEDWTRVYSESFDRLSAGTITTTGELANWEGGSASGTVFDGRTETAGKFLVATSAWNSFNQGPILNLNLAAVPHDRVRVRFDLYTFGDWRGLQRASGGPQHRLMFFDSKASPRFAFDTNFSSNKQFQQSWPHKNPADGPALRGGAPEQLDATGRYKLGHRWAVEFEYASDSGSLRFTMLCGAGAGGGKAMPHFGIDNVEVLVRSTAPRIVPVDRTKEMQSAHIQGTPDRGSRITLSLKQARRVSLGVFDRKSGRLLRTLLVGEPLDAGTHSIAWDGLDNLGVPVSDAMELEWRCIATPGFTARYVTTIGINPPGGEHPVPRRSWVGDHIGGGIVDVDQTGIYVGSPMTEGMMMLVKVNATKSGIDWSRQQFYEGGRLTKAATNGTRVFTLHPTGKLRRLNRETGRVEAQWQISSAEQSPTDVDASGLNLVVAEPTENRIRWISPTTGESIASVSISGANAVAVLENTEHRATAVAAGASIFVASPTGGVRRVVANIASSLPPEYRSLLGAKASIGAMDYDPDRKELWIVVNGHLVARLDERFKVQQTYGGRPREMGPIDPTRFAGAGDIAADLKGGFLIGEPGHPPRRIAQFDREGKLVQQWFGGMSFYIGGTFDPEDPSRLYGIAPEGSINVYKIDYESGSWDIEACYSTGRLGDSLFPGSGAFKAVRRGGQTYLYHRVIPAVIRLDAQQRKAVPVAIAGRVLNQGRTFFQFAGSGREGYPKPWVKAAEHHGYQDLKSAPKLYSWADTNGNGETDPEEFRFYPNADKGLSFHNPGDFTAGRDYIGAAGTNQSGALLRLPVGSWEGPEKAAPRWDWDRLESKGTIIANTYGYGSPRGLSVAPSGRVAVSYQAGIMIREHGQYEGGSWPEAALRGGRVLGFDAQLQPLFAAGRQSKLGPEASTGVLYYPMQTTFGPNGSVVVNDQTKQPAQVWTYDGLYVGGFFDHRADDELDPRFYQVHGDDNQGVTLVNADNGKTYWLMPYQGHNRLYEINGWSHWYRATGPVTTPRQPSVAAQPGTGLTARYVQAARTVLETIEDPTYFERFGAERHSDQVTPHYKVTWTGFVAPPLTDRYQFYALLGKAEQVSIWVDGQLVYAAGFDPKQNVALPVDLFHGHRHRLRIEYINPDGRAELKLLWSSRVLDPQRLPISALFPES